jgi:VCBS repeat-containing protein
VPSRLDYDEAMRFSKVRLKIPDLELKKGSVEMVSIPTSIGSIQKPWGTEGGFAVVYKFRMQSGQFSALRCYLRPVSSDMQFRYQHLNSYFQAHVHDITIPFTYHDYGIEVKEQGRFSGKVYPLIEMDWLDGLTLIEQVDALCRKRDLIALKNLYTQWQNLLCTMRQEKIAHGDLAGENVMVMPDGRLILVDYDGVYISTFEGLPPLLSGKPDYQHPQMGQRERPFNEHMDAFSALVISTTLLALTVQPELWDRYTIRDPQGKMVSTNLLLSQQDFQNPKQSDLLKILEQSSHEQVKHFAQALKSACCQPIEDVRFPFYLIEAEYRLLTPPSRNTINLPSYTTRSESVREAVKPISSTQSKKVYPVRAKRGRARRSRERRSGGMTAIILILILIILSITVPVAVISYLGNYATSSHNNTPSDLYPPAVATLALSDSLSSNTGGGTTGANNNGGDCEFTDGVLQASQSKSGSFMVCALNANQYRNFSFEVGMRVTQGDAGGLIFRSTNSSGQFYALFISQDGGYTLDVYNTDNQIQTLANGTSSAIQKGLNQLNVIALTAKGSTITIFANQQQVAQVQNSTFTRGTIGLIASAYGDNITPNVVDYSNLKVWTF